MLSCAGATSWQHAGTAVGHVATLRGRVASTKYAAYSNGSPTFLNIGRPYPNEGLSVVIWIENRAAFRRPEVRYRGHTICVRGLVSRYQGVPEIVARSPGQIRIIR
jgi:DNA/RNA endonuclease YhcR with UshA esterase domain